MSDAVMTDVGLQQLQVLSDHTRLATLRHYFKAQFGVTLTVRPLVSGGSVHEYLGQVTP